MIKKKYIIVSSVVILILIIILLLASLLKGTNKKDNTTTKTFTPEFLSTAELNTFKIATSTKAEVIKRDPSGKVIIYRIINSDKDIVNPEEVKPIIGN
jgi:competence protein ComGF